MKQSIPLPFQVSVLREFLSGKIGFTDFLDSGIGETRTRIQEVPRSTVLGVQEVKNGILGHLSLYVSPQTPYGIYILNTINASNQNERLLSALAQIDSPFIPLPFENGEAYVNANYITIHGGNSKESKISLTGHSKIITVQEGLDETRRKLEQHINPFSAHLSKGGYASGRHSENVLRRYPNDPDIIIIGTVTSAHFTP